jgi:hypothetical protein
LPRCSTAHELTAEVEGLTRAAAPDLEDVLDAAVRTQQQLRQVNVLCRLVEMATEPD